MLTPAELEAEDLWREEIRRRIEQIDRGAVELIDWQHARGRLWDHLAR